jgi:hypothetical protein
MAAGDITYVEQRVSRLDMDLPGHHSHYSYLQEITEMTTKQKLLDQAKEAVADRGLNYGTPEDNFKRIAEHWNVLLVNRHQIDEYKQDHGFLTPGDVAIMMALMKIARLEHQPDHEDSWVDLAGYAACGAEIVCPDKEPAAAKAWPDSVDDISKEQKVALRTYYDQFNTAANDWPDSVDDGA